MLLVFGCANLLQNTIYRTISINREDSKRKRHKPNRELLELIPVLHSNGKGASQAGFRGLRLGLGRGSSCKSSPWESSPPSPPLLFLFFPPALAFALACAFAFACPFAFAFAFARPFALGFATSGADPKEGPPTAFHCCFSFPAWLVRLLVGISLSDSTLRLAGRLGIGWKGTIISWRWEVILNCKLLLSPTPTSSFALRCPQNPLILARDSFVITNSF